MYRLFKKFIQALCHRHYQPIYVAVSTVHWNLLWKRQQDVISVIYRTWLQWKIHCGWHHSRRILKLLVPNIRKNLTLVPCLQYFDLKYVGYDFSFVKYFINQALTKWERFVRPFQSSCKKSGKQSNKCRFMGARGNMSFWCCFSFFSTNYMCAKN